MAIHLFKEDDNDSINVIETISGGTDRKAVEDSLDEMQLYTRMTKGKIGIFTVAINPSKGETLTPEQHARAVEIIEEEFGLKGQVRLQVEHVKEGRKHSHVFWSRVDQEKGVLIPLSNDRYRLQDCADEMTREFNHEPVRRTANENTIEVTNADRMMDARNKAKTKKDNVKRQTAQERKQEISALWNGSKDAQDFLNQVRTAGYEVGKGERSRFVVIDKEGVPHNLVRDLPKLVKTKDVRARFGDLEKELLSVELANQMRIDRQERYDREQANNDSINKELDAADKEAKKPSQQDKPQTPREIVQDNKPPKSIPKKLPIDPAYKKLDQQQKRQREIDYWMAKHEQEADKAYDVGASEKHLQKLRGELAKTKRTTMLGGVRKAYSELEAKIDAAQATHDDMMTRRNEFISGKRKEVEAKFPEQEQQIPANDEPAISLEADKQRRIEEHKARFLEELNRKSDRERGDGFDFER